MAKTLPIQIKAADEALEGFRDPRRPHGRVSP